jgi:hypothetical protein
MSSNARFIGMDDGFFRLNSFLASELLNHFLHSYVRACAKTFSEHHTLFGTVQKLFESTHSV